MDFVMVENVESLDNKEWKYVRAWYFNGLEEKLSVFFVQWNAYLCWSIV
jgi:hypothetical protein